MAENAPQDQHPAEPAEGSRQEHDGRETAANKTPNGRTGAPLAVVTGASTGIGRELALCLARGGYDLVLAAENPELDDAARAAEALGATVRQVRVDLALPEGVDELAASVSGRPVEALVINAGVGVNGPFAGDTPLQDHLRVVDLNARSAVHLAKALTPEMVRRGRGRVLFTSSIAATMPGPFQSVYNASKAFLQSFSEALREELKGTGVTVTSLQPGPTETEFFVRARMRDTKLGAGAKDSAAAVARQGYEAMLRGKDSVVAGSPRNRAQVAVARIAPERLMAAVHRRMSEPGSAQR